MMMDCVNKRYSAKTSKSKEYYKKVWLTLFDLKILASCEDDDPDVFGVSALLKTTLCSFTTLKKRFVDSQNLVEALTWELKKTKTENESYIKELKDLKTMKCNCFQSLNGIQLISPEECSSMKKLAVNELNVQNVYSKTKKQRSGSPLVENQIISEESSCRTPEKKPASHSIETLSPVLNSLKRSKRFTRPTVVLEGNSKSISKPPKFSSNSGSPEEVMVCSQSVLEQSFTDNKSSFVQNSKRRLKISSLSLRRKKPKFSPPKLQVSNNKPQVQREAKRDCVNESAGQTLGQKHPNGNCGPCDGGALRRDACVSEVPCPKGTASARGEEEDEIIMPSPSQCETLMEKKGDGGAVFKSPPKVTRKLGKTKMSPFGVFEKHIQEVSAMDTDTDATYFVPTAWLQEQEGSERSGEVGLGWKSAMGEQSDAEEEMPARTEHCEDAGRYQEDLLCSFDSVPLKSTSPRFKYQQAVAVRKQSERRKMPGWECKGCRKYYDEAGLDSFERRNRVNKCSRHRDKFSPRKCTPKGYWDPLFPETPE